MVLVSGILCLAYCFFSILRSNVSRLFLNGILLTNISLPLSRSESVYLSVEG